MNFIYTWTWWLAFIFCNILGLLQLIGYYGNARVSPTKRGRHSQIIERVSFLIILTMFIYVLFTLGWTAGILLIILTLLINTLVAKPIAVKIIKKLLS